MNLKRIMAIGVSAITIYKVVGILNAGVRAIGIGLGAGCAANAHPELMPEFRKGLEQVVNDNKKSIKNEFLAKCVLEGFETQTAKVK